MIILVDTNILLRTAKPDDRDHTISETAISSLTNDGHILAVVPQCLYEYYVVATRPVDQNGLGLEPAVAVSAIDQLLSLFRCYRDERAVFELWKSLVDDFQVRGKPAHDARLIAAMKRHEIRHLLTFNGKDFKRYTPDIEIIDPRNLQMPRTKQI